MEHSRPMVLQAQQRFFELKEEAIVSSAAPQASKQLSLDLSQYTAKIRALTIGMVGILTMPLCGLMAGDEILWEKLQALIEAERPARTQSTVLAVDTSAVSVRSKSASESTKELFEQAAMEHLARLHHTFNSWAERNEELMGSVSLKLMVDASGNVVRVEPVNANINNSSFIKTVMDDVSEWKFPKNNAEAAEIIVPLLFIPKGMDPEMIVQWERKLRAGPRDDKPRVLPVATAAVANTIPEKVAEIAIASPLPTVQEQKIVTPLPVAPQAAPPAAVKPIAVATAAPAPKTRAEAKSLAVVVANRQLAMRDNPRYSANSVREIQEATQLSILEQRGDWLKVRAGGQVGFVRKEYVSPVS